MNVIIILILINILEFRFLNIFLNFRIIKENIFKII